MALDDDIIRIMIHTDSHLGFKERDPIRGDDSFAAFEEALKESKRLHADMVIHAGDMFHENKPTRRTMHRAMKIFRENCLGDDPVYITCANEQNEVFHTNQGRVNYEDPFHSVSLPYFAIHGNHDDPSREGAGGEALAALDLLAMSNLINYYGKSESVEEIDIHPVLIKKNGTKLALFGLGAVRDERLNRLWRNKKVRFVRPRDIDGEEKWFNILVLHQNRDYGRGTKNCIHESMIPQWVNVVIWGNEHECQPELAETLVGTFRIYQPGSSIATSLVKTESCAFPKKFGILEIRGIKFRLKTYNFSQVRPFIYSEIKLQELSHLDPQDPNIEDKIAKVLQHKIDSMIAQGMESARAVETGAQTLQLDNRVKDPRLILLRVRVEHEGFISLNQQRFGALFVGKVANPSELLLFSKSKKYGGGRTAGTSAGATRRLPTFLQGGNTEDGDDANKISLDDLVFESLSKSSSLSILPSTEMELAINSFVVKKNANAINDAVQHALEVAQDSIWQDKGAAATKESISTAASLLKQRVESKAGSTTAVQKKSKSDMVAEWISSKPALDTDSDIESKAKEPAKRGRAKAKSPAKKTTSKRGKSDHLELSDSIQDSDEELQLQGKKSSKATKVATARPSRANAKKSYVGEDDASDEDRSVSPEEVEFAEESEDDEAPKRGKKAAPKKPAAKKVPATKKAAPNKSGKPSIEEVATHVMDLVSSDEDRRPAAKQARQPVSQVLLTAGYTPTTGSILNDSGVGTGISAIAVASTGRKRALPGALATKQQVAHQDWD